MRHLRSAAYAVTQLLPCAVVVVGAHALVPAAARASCAGPGPNVIWSSPAKDETDVPLDADLLLVTEGIAFEHGVTLDGEPLTAASEVPGHYDLGTLAASTEHVVAIEARDPRTGARVELSWSFTTGERGRGRERLRGGPRRWRRGRRPSTRAMDPRAGLGRVPATPAANACLRGREP